MLGAPGPRTISFAVGGPIDRADLPALCERVSSLLAGSGAAVALCDVSGARDDAMTVEALARMQLAARRSTCQMRLRGASTELLGLLAFMGLRDVLPPSEG